MMRLTVLIPTYNRPDRLRLLLDTLQRQTLDAMDFEVIVVDDGSTADYTEVVETPWPFALRYLRQANAGEAVARNFGVSAASTGFIVFLDDDMTLVPEYLEQLYAEYQAHPTAILLGNMIVPQEAGGTIFQRRMAQDMPPNETGFVPFTAMAAGVLAMDRQAYLALGGMQPLPGRKRGGWMDLAFAFRAHERGYRFRRCAAAIAFHHDDSLSDRTKYTQRVERIARIAPTLFAFRPGLKAHIAMFRHVEPVDWRHDRPRLLARKLAWRVLAARPMTWLMEALADLLEKWKLDSTLLLLLYRWLKEVYKLRGYQQGLREVG